jgi:hypothetical protein
MDFVKVFVTKKAKASLTCSGSYGNVRTRLRIERKRVEELDWGVPDM